MKFTIDDFTIEHILKLAEQAGFKSTGNLIEDTQREFMLMKFATLVGTELEKKNR